MKKNKNKNFILYIMKIRRYISKNKSKKKIRRNLKQRNLKTRKFKPHYKKKTLPLLSFQMPLKTNLPLIFYF